mgnify:CR=1 FL=1
MQFYEQAMTRYNQTTADPKKKNYFEITLTLILLIILLVMIYPAITHIITLNKEIQAGRVVDKALGDKIVALNQAQDNFAKVEKDLPLLELALPVGSDLDKYVQKPIESLSTKNSLTVKSIQFSDVPVSKPTTEDVRLRQMEFTMSLTGAFPNLLAFVKDLESFVRVTSVDTLQLKASGAELAITLQGTTNFLGTAVTAAKQANQKEAAQ